MLQLVQVECNEGVDNEQLLVRRAKEGDTTALRAVYKLYVRYLTAVCSRYITNSEDVKDILQDSFLKIFSTLDSYEYRGGGTLKSWLTKIVVNETLKFINKNNRLVDCSQSRCVAFLCPAHQ